MSRVERFREIRQTRMKYLSSFFIFMVLLIPGIFISDYSINCLMYNERHIAFVSIQSVDNSHLQINLLNNRYQINTTYIKRDLQRLKKLLTRE